MMATTTVRVSDPLEVLALPMRVYNACRRNNVQTVGDLLTVSEREFLRFRNIGEGSLRDLRAILEAHGLDIPAEPLETSRQRDVPKVTQAQANGLAIKIKDAARYERIEVSPVILNVHPKQRFSALYDWGPKWEEGYWMLELHSPVFDLYPAYISAVRLRYDESTKIMDYVLMNGPLRDAMKGLAPLTLSDTARIKDALKGAAPEPPLEATVSDQIEVIIRGSEGV